MKFSMQITAPILLAASLASPALAYTPGPSRTLQVRKDNVVLAPGGSWSKAGPMLVRRNHSALRRAVPFGKVESAPLAVRAVVEERGDEGEDVEFIDCSEYDDEEGDDDEEEEPQQQVGTVAGAPAPAPTPSSSSSEPAWSPAPSSSSSAPAVQAAAPAPSPASIDIDWSQFQNPKINKPIEGDLPLASPKPQAAPQAASGNTAEAPAAAPADSAPVAPAAPAAPAADEKATANPDNIAPDTLTVEDGCIRYHTVVPGEVCLGVLDGSKDLALTLDQFYEYNPAIDSVCSNLQVGWAVCTGKSS